MGFGQLTFKKLTIDFPQVSYSGILCRETNEATAFSIHIWQVVYASQQLKHDASLSSVTENEATMNNAEVPEGY